MKIHYRPEIDGLRAIAVTSVILYHAQITILGYQPFRGGFIGVDIFFVISGYLITSIILKELLITGLFSFKHFYERRIRRILPALLFVMLVSLPIAWMYLLPSSFVDFSKSILYSIGFSSNFYFHGIGQQYGATDALLVPFLHTWSLSVEEQYYILFPIVLLIIFKFFKEHIIHILIFSFVVSLGLAEWGSNNYTSATFYFLHTRMWEILAGSILAYFEITKGHRNKYKILNLLLPTLGIILIGYSILYFKDQSTPHPSFYTLIPVLGVCLIIWFSDKNEIFTKLLSSKLLVSIGLISYSLYLWHYPIFAFDRIIEFSNEEILKKILLGIIILLFSIVSYYFIEKPFRNKNYNFKHLGSSIIFIIIFISLIQIMIIKNDGYRNRFNIIYNSLKNFEIDNKYLVEERNNYYSKSLEKNTKFKNDNINILVIGDSHGEDLFIALNLNYELFKNYNFRFIHYGYFKKNTEILKNKHYKESDIIIFSARWISRHRYFKDISDNLIYFLQKKNNKKILVTSNSNEYSKLNFQNKELTYIDRIVLQNLSNLDNLNFKEYDNFYYKNSSVNSSSKFNLLLKNFSKKNNITFLNKEDFMCNRVKKKCDYITPEGFKIFYDYGHYTVEGAKYFGKKIYQTNWLKIK